MIPTVIPLRRCSALVLILKESVINRPAGARQRETERERERAIYLMMATTPDTPLLVNSDTDY